MHRTLILGATLALCCSVAPSHVLAGAANGCQPQPNSNIGCEFYAVALPNPILDQQTFAFGVALSNTVNASLGVVISGGSLVTPVSMSVPPMSAIIAPLPWVSATSTATTTTKVTGGAYHITTNGPIAAVQMNPVDPVVAATAANTADASLLLPVESAGRAFHIVTWPTWTGGATQYPAHVAIVATVDATVVTVAAPGSMQAGAGLDANGGLAALNRGDVLLISSTLVDGSDLSGTTITSSYPVLVWSGHAAAAVPSGTPFADHLEETVAPDSALDTDYLIVRPANASGIGTGTRAYVSLLGTVDGTGLTFDPPLAGFASALDAGAKATGEITGDHHLHADHPVVVAQFMEGSMAPDFTDGDPSQTFALSMHAGKRRIDFVAPLEWAPVTADVVAPTGSQVTLDAAPVTGWSAIGSSGWSVAHVPICCTYAHHATGDHPFHIVVHAYPADSGASYWLPAALGTDDRVFADGFE